MARYKTVVRWLAASSCCLFLLTGVADFSTVSAAAAANQSGSIDQSVTQAYDTDEPIQKGMIVRLKSGDSRTVVPLDIKHASDMLGVVVAPNDAAVSLSNDTPDTRQAYVATFGRFDVLVSNENGAIKPGDYITISSLAGIGMEADGYEPIVIGKANSGFNGTSSVEGSATVTNGDGSKRGVSIGRISVTVTVAHNPMQKKVTTTFPGVFQQIGSDIANKPVSATRIYMALAVLVICTIVAGSLLYSGVRSSLISIGRNPLAKKSIMRSLLQVIITSLIVFIIGVFGVYLLIRL